MTKRKTDRAPQPPVQPVSGPRPLPLLMAMETSTLLGSLAALTSSSSGWPPLKPDQVRPELAARASELQKALANVPADAFYRAATAEARKRLDAFTQGVRLYRLADRPPRPTEPKTVWHDGSTRLLDYGDTPQAIDSNGPISILIPSPAQRSWLFDADAEHSLLRDLAARGLTILIAEQNWRFAISVASDVLVMDQGQIVHRDSMAGFAADTDAHAADYSSARGSSSQDGSSNGRLSAELERASMIERASLFNRASKAKQTIRPDGNFQFLTSMTDLSMFIDSKDGHELGPEEIKAKRKANKS